MGLGELVREMNANVLLCTHIIAQMEPRLHVINVGYEEGVFQHLFGVELDKEVLVDVVGEKSQGCCPSFGLIHREAFHPEEIHSSIHIHLAFLSLDDLCGRHQLAPLIVVVEERKDVVDLGSGGKLWHLGDQVEPLGETLLDVPEGGLVFLLDDQVDLILVLRKVEAQMLLFKLHLLVDLVGQLVYGGVEVLLYVHYGGPDPVNVLLYLLQGYHPLGELKVAPPPLDAEGCPFLDHPLHWVLMLPLSQAVGPVGHLDPGGTTHFDQQSVIVGEELSFIFILSLSVPVQYSET
mmetsp:Transcript_35972/g.34980  ORF Transcript_35972/g.34980 Transcript_35972/m.34980 type:complete len:292 (-) Transcript_35972:186-1061(-)|eukprot:CAMPEP_0170566644 /NCGR_PEP_ID=MMETSP0211-20121228/79972_1 /TAXON_ID=311385 /ORGANISM="Pseudokeronopsis sp., Strain OXSARD2" /LENGTH=291 /DNA_ID=CAMNT_0010887881 /DNA_START=1094 /DNA_END=1969 /DNA_ORIENTATION=+